MERPKLEKADPLTTIKYMKFSDAIERFSTWRRFKVKEQTVKGYDKELRTFCLFLRNPELENVSLIDVMDYLNGMQDLGWSHNSFVPKCMALRKFFEFYRLQGYRVLDENLIPIPRKALAIPRVLTLRRKSTQNPGHRGR